ncbi:Sulfite exporter TauE/SafE [Marinobacterium sp. xm-a-121]|uniref:sulfite exporter TauE/SafE family protein n=1 Tax=unclassified Marinobacterium TaxID=2644139 RepID=UPI001568E0EC|nr:MULTISPECIES: sulfite exporter TauE/SafE family protein [unclassified Marinobacterium]NRP39510.1 Sulfite exporter TauE/SafE [Marinobacterium sp. xm-a-121]NRQ00387.1 Sulfite exporter TauE/SafE [Marinobacterium sp. xm-v-233]
MIEFGSTAFVIALIAAWFVGLSKGGLPIIAMLSVPILSLVMSPMTGAILLLPIYIISDMVAVWLYRKHFSMINLKNLIPAGLLGVFIGWATASIVSDQFVALLIGIMGLTFVSYIWFGKRQVKEAKKPTIVGGWIWGTIAGFTSFISHTGGPPFQVYVLPQKLEKLVFAGTATLFFAVINLSKLPPYLALRGYSTEDLTLALWMVPSALLGTFMGAKLTKILKDRWFFGLVEVGLLLVSIKLIHGVIVESLL